MDLAMHPRWASDMGSMAEQAPASFSPQLLSSFFVVTSPNTTTASTNTCIKLRRKSRRRRSRSPQLFLHLIPFSSFGLHCNSFYSSSKRSQVCFDRLALKRRPLVCITAKVPWEEDPWRRHKQRCRRGRGPMLRTGCWALRYCNILIISILWLDS